MKHPWFKPWGWIYLPASWQGVVVVMLALGFTVQVFLAVDRNSHSASDTLFGVFPFFVSCWAVAYWVAAKTSRSAP